LTYRHSRVQESEGPNWLPYLGVYQLWKASSWCLALLNNAVETRSLRAHLRLLSAAGKAIEHASQTVRDACHHLFSSSGAAAHGSSSKSNRLAALTTWMFQTNQGPSITMWTERSSPEAHILHSSVI